MTASPTRVLARTRRRLFAVTLGLVALLVVGIGAASAFVALRALDAEVDRALAATVDRAVIVLSEAGSGTTPAPPSGVDGDGGDDAGDDYEEGGLASADTFLLVLDRSGGLVANPSGVTLPGLPDGAAVAAAADGEDIRTIDAGGTPVRLRTVPVVASPDDNGTGGAVRGYVQGGFVLTLHDQQSRSIVLAVIIVGLVGLVGAAIVTLVVTGRALVPIRRSMEAQQRFVADASHELRTPVALIRANADVVEREDLVADDGRPLVADIITEADRLGRLVGDLLQLATADASGITVHLERLDLAAVASDTVRQADAFATQRGVRLAMGTMAGDGLLVDADRERIVQLLLILLDNAFDHSPDGGPVRVAVDRSGSEVQLTVTDAGPGVPEADRDRVFEPFTRSPGVRRERAGGTGLGLAIARRIATAHHGTIRVEDAPGGGAAFVLSLPAAV